MPFRTTPTVLGLCSSSAPPAQDSRHRVTVGEIGDLDVPTAPGRHHRASSVTHANQIQQSYLYNSTFLPPPKSYILYIHLLFLPLPSFFSSHIRTHYFHPSSHPFIFTVSLSSTCSLLTHPQPSSLILTNPHTSTVCNGTDFQLKQGHTHSAPSASVDSLAQDPTPFSSRPLLSHH